MSESLKRRIYWRGIFAQYASGNQSVNEFCHENHISRRTFYKWRGLLSEEQPAGTGGRLSELTLQPVSGCPFSGEAQSGMQPDSGVSVETGSVRIRLSREFDAESLRRVLETVGGMSC